MQCTAGLQHFSWLQCKFIQPKSQSEEFEQCTRNLKFVAGIVFAIAAACLAAFTKVLQKLPAQQTYAAFTPFAILVGLLAFPAAIGAQFDNLLSGLYGIVCRFRVCMRHHHVEAQQASCSGTERCLWLEGRLQTWGAQLVDWLFRGVECFVGWLTSSTQRAPALPVVVHP